MGLLDELLGGLAQGGLDQAMGRQSPRGRGGLGQQPAGSQGGGMSSVLMTLLPLVLSMLANRQGGGGLGGNAGNMGGLGGLLEQFQRMGYADQAKSWVGTGANLPISPEIIAQVFGRDGLSQLASQAGLTESEASVGLSQILPDVVDRLTPQGQMPDLDALVASVSDLERRFRG
ncbi:MAG TPA: YidB family protein [Burkholderiales bacterium]|nr:YidB family protein [Burkholderiales bacterium]